MKEPEPRRRDRDRTRQDLLAAARLRFARDGYSATSVRGIAEAAGVDAALVFRYFGSKRALFEEVTLSGRDGSSMLDGPAEDLPARMLDTVVFQDWSQFAGEHPLIALLRSSGTEGVRQQLCEEVCTTYVDGLAALLDTPDAKLRAELLSAWILGIALMRSAVGTPALSEVGPEELEPYFAQVADYLLNRP